MNRAHFGPISRQRAQASPAHAAAGPRRYNAAMHDIPNRIADVLLEIEATLRTPWPLGPGPAAGQVAGQHPAILYRHAALRAMAAVGVPAAHAADPQRVPAHCQPGAGSSIYAEQCLRKNDPPTGALLECIRRFDELIAIQSAPRRH